MTGTLAEGLCPQAVDEDDHGSLHGRQTEPVLFVVQGSEATWQHVGQPGLRGSGGR